MFLAVDVGNSETSIGVFDGEVLRLNWRMATDIARTEDEMGLSVLSMLHLRGIPETEIDGVGIASVVPPATEPVVKMGRKYLGAEPLLVGPASELGLAIAYRRPEEVGADRLANAVAAEDRFGAPVIVVDFGTATTFDVVSADRAYLGGVIVPGVITALDGLIRRASKLPRIDLLRPERVIGQSTVEALQSGVIHGTVGQVDHLVRRIQEELGQKTPVIATGGLAKFLAPECETVDRVEPALTLEGIRLVYERTTSGRRSTAEGLPRPGAST